MQHGRALGWVMAAWAVGCGDSKAARSPNAELPDECTASVGDYLGYAGARSRARTDDPSTAR